MIKFIAIIFFFLLSTSATAGRLYLLTDGTTQANPGNAISDGCTLSLHAAYGAYGFSSSAMPSSGSASYDFNYISQSLGLPTRALGSDLLVRCVGNLDGSVLIAYATIIPTQTCDVGTPSRLIQFTTIASFAANGDVVQADPISNPQCQDNCVSQFSGGSLTGALAYTDIGDPIEVGSPMWFVGTNGVAFTGETCRFVGSNQPDLVKQSVLPPYDQLNDLSGQHGNGGGTGGGTGGGATGGGLTAAQDSILNSIYSNTQNAKTKLDNIDAKIDALLNGTGGNPDGTPDVIDVGTFGVMPQAPIAEAPAGGLVSPSETGLTTFKSGLFSSPDRAAGTCPTWTVHIGLLSNTSTHGDYTFNQHCDLVDSHRGALETVMTVIWSVGALAVVLKA